MKLPLGMEAFRSIRAGLVAWLLRSIYGLRQSGRLWNQKVIAFFKSIGFRALNAHFCILVQQMDKDIILVGVYVDDFLLAANQQDPLDWIKKELQKEYNIKELGEVKTIISWQATQSSSTMKIDQSAFIRHLIEKEGMRDCNPVYTPMKTGNFTEIQGEIDYEEVDLKVYQRLIGKLIYLSCGTRSDISFIIEQLS